MGKPRDVLLLTGPYLESGYPTIAEYAERSNWRLEIAERDISAHFGPSQVAADLGISLRRLNAISKTELGHSVLDEIVRLRIERAKRLILSTDDKLAAIAAATGFCNASYFSKVFLRLVGLSPREWRARQR